jgi:hypothetical protein
LEFIENFRGLYPEVYGGGTSEGNSALEYFNKWGFYATLFDLANGNKSELDILLQTNIHEIHTLLACRNDTMKLKHSIQTQN